MRRQIRGARGLEVKAAGYGCEVLPARDFVAAQVGGMLRMRGNGSRNFSCQEVLVEDRLGAGVAGWHLIGFLIYGIIRSRNPAWSDSRMESDDLLRPNPGIGIQIASADPYWVVVHESAYGGGRELGVRGVSRDLDLELLTGEEQVGWLEELVAQDLNALVVQGIDQALAHTVLDAGVPLIVASETDLHIPW